MAEAKSARASSRITARAVAASAAKVLVWLLKDGQWRIVRSGAACRQTGPVRGLMMFNGMMIRSVSGLVSGFTLLCAAAASPLAAAVAVLPPPPTFPTPAASAPPPRHRSNRRRATSRRRRHWTYCAARCHLRAHREASIPFSYTDGRRSRARLLLGLCMRIVDAVKVRLNQPSIEVVPVFATSARAS